MQFREVDLVVPRYGAGGPEGEGKRSAGLHLSQILYHMKTVGAGRELGAYGETPDRLSQERMMLGFILERAMAEHFQDGEPIMRQDEVERDGIFMTPDGVNFKDNHLEEYKCTWLSGAEFADCHLKHETMRWWLYQMKCYCHALNLTQARLTVMFVNDCYNHMRRVKLEGMAERRLRRMEFVFTAEELANTWEVVLRNAKGLR